VSTWNGGTKKIVVQTSMKSSDQLSHIKDRANQCISWSPDTRLFVDRESCEVDGLVSGELEWLELEVLGALLHGILFT
jgi:hypothetical protein